MLNGKTRFEAQQEARAYIMGLDRESLFMFAEIQEIAAQEANDEIVRRLNRDLVR